MNKPTAFNYAEFEALRAAYEKQKEINKEWVDDCEKLQADNATLKADLAAAKKCISDVETYLEMGSGKYAYLVIQGWRGRKEQENE